MYIWKANTERLGDDFLPSYKESKLFNKNIFFSLKKTLTLISGMAVKQTPDGECEERSYRNGKLEGEATVIYADSSKELRNYQVKTLSNINWSCNCYHSFVG
jgi:hypothetical protein